MYATCPDHPSPHDLMLLVIFGEGYKLRICSLCILLLSPCNLILLTFISSHKILVSLAFWLLFKMFTVWWFYIVFKPSIPQHVKVRTPTWLLIKSN
jgi:hypothetical protein